MNIHERGTRARQAERLEREKVVNALADQFSVAVLDLWELLFPHDDEKKILVDDVPLGFARHVVDVCKALAEGTDVTIGTNTSRPHPRNNHMGNRVPATPQPTPPAPDTPPATPQPTPRAATPPPLSPLPASARRTDEGILARWRRR